MKSHRRVVAAFLALFIVLSTYAMFSFLLIYGTKLEEKYTILIIQGVIAVLMLIVGYFFGSSDSSRSKDDAIVQSMPPGRTCCRDENGHEHETLPRVKKALVHKRMKPEGG